MACGFQPLFLCASSPHNFLSPYRNVVFPAPPPPPPIRTSSLTSRASVSPPFKRFTPFSSLIPPSVSHSIDPQFAADGGNGGFGSGSGGNSTGGNSGDFWGWWSPEAGGSTPPIDPFLLLFLFSRAYLEKATYMSKWSLVVAATLLSHFFCFQLPAAALNSPEGDDDEGAVVYEVRGGKWIKLVPTNDSFIVAEGGSSGSEKSISIGGIILPDWSLHGTDLFMRLMLPEGYPHSVTSDYLDYSLWRGVQGIASQVSGVLATQALLYAVGLGKGAIPTAAAVNWVLKDGIGYISKIFLSKFGRHFDVHPKGWRLFADLLENAAFGLEIMTPAFPHLFVYIGTAAGAGRSAAALIQAATRSCFFAGFAAQRNFAEVIAKGEAQGMVSRSIGIALGIGLANCIGNSTPLALASFTVVTWIHMFCNLKSYQSIQLRTLNPYRGSLVFSEYLLTGQAPSVKEVNAEEPLFPAAPFFNGISAKPRVDTLSLAAKDAAAEIENRLYLGTTLSDVVRNKEDAVALFELFRNEGYVLAENQGKYCVVLKESASPQDMLKSLFHVNYLYWLERNAGIVATKPSVDCRESGRLRMSLDYVQREFQHAKQDAESIGWVTDGLIARPLPNRIRVPYSSLVAAA